MFRVGMKVRCVDDRGLYYVSGCTDPVFGGVYTVDAFGLVHGVPCIRLAEISNPGLLGFYRQTRFRPIVERKTDISFAHEILRKATKQADTDIGASA